MRQDWQNNAAQSALPLLCFRIPGVKCDAWMMDLRGDGNTEIVVLSGIQVTAYQTDQTGLWRLAATWTLQFGCKPVMDAARAGQFKPMPPAPPWPDLEVAGQHFRASQPVTPPTCPPQP
jgi:hypothetical protein